MNMFQRLEAWFATIWHHFHAGTLPDPPVAGSPVTLPPVNPDVTTPPAPPVPPGTTTAALPTGVVIVDQVNGLVTVDPSLGNPDTAGQTFNGEAFLSLFDPESQAAYTTRQNNADALSAQGPGQLGIHFGVWPMVATGDTRKFVYAPKVIGETMDRIPWIPHAWTITGGTIADFLDHVLHHWKLPTSSNPDAHGFVPGK